MGEEPEGIDLETDTRFFVVAVDDDGNLEWDEEQGFSDLEMLGLAHALVIHYSRKRYEEIEDDE